MSRRTLWLARCGLLCAVALLAAALEQLIPALPMLPPGAKPGLANIAVLAAGYTLGPGAAFWVALVKVLFALTTRGVTAFLMSLAGSLLSTAVMLIMLHIPLFGTVGIGVGGAVAHNLAQMSVAAVLLTGGVQYYLPWMLLFAVITGSLTGILFGLLQPSLTRLMLLHT